MKKKIAVAVTVALLALPLSTTLTLADSAIPTTTASITTTVDPTASETTVTQAEEAVSAYEAASITTLAKVAEANSLKAEADTAVAAVNDETIRAAFEQRITNRAAKIAIATTILQAEVAVSAYEAGPLNTLAQIATAEGLKGAADTAVASVADVTAKVAFEQRVKNRAAAIVIAKTTATPVVDANGNTVTPSNWIADLIAKLQLALTFDPAHKAELNERHALEKLAEAQKLMKEQEPEAAQTCLNEYTDKITKAQSFLEQVKDPTSETAKSLAKALVNVNSNNVQVLSNLLDKLPPQAAQKLALNVVRSMDKAVQKIQKEDAKVTPATTSTTSTTDNEVLKKQAKVALENFKKSLNQKGTIHIEDQEQGDNEDQTVTKQSKPELVKQEREQKSHKVIQNQSPQYQSFTLNQPTHVTVASIKPQMSATVTKPSEHGAEDRSKRAENEKSKDGHKAENHRN